MSNFANSTLYTGVCNNLVKRVWQHRNGQGSVFTKKYSVTKLVYYEVFEEIIEAIIREKQIKGGSRADKLKLITQFNPTFKDLYNDISK